MHVTDITLLGLCMPPIHQPTKCCQFLLCFQVTLTQQLHSVDVFQCQLWWLVGYSHDTSSFVIDRPDRFLTDFQPVEFHVIGQIGGQWCLDDFIKTHVDALGLRVFIQLER
ncbi:hypothetical protein WV31_01105 [Magnetospirillum sp. ME-1]|nr:hypothetical protein WV31_01105 [Magnetospirillum sp. ME-1]